MTYFRHVIVHVLDKSLCEFQNYYILIAKLMQLIIFIERFAD